MNKPPRNYASYFDLCQVIGGNLEEVGRRVAKDGIHAPVLYQSIIDELRSVQNFCDRAIVAVTAAQDQWEQTEQ